MVTSAIGVPFSEVGLPVSLGHFGRAGESRVHGVPARRVGGIDDHPGAKSLLIVQAAGAQHQHVGPAGTLAVHRGAAIRAEAAPDRVAAVGGPLVERSLAGDRRRGLGHHDVRGVAGPARLLAGATVAVPGHDGLGGALVADRAALAAPPQDRAHAIAPSSRACSRQSKQPDQPWLCRLRLSLVSNPSWVSSSRVPPGVSCSSIVTTVSWPRAPSSSQPQVKTRRSGGTISRYTPLTT